MYLLMFPVIVFAQTLVFWALVVQYVYPVLDLSAQWAMWQHAIYHPVAHVNPILVLSLCGIIAFLVTSLLYLLLAQRWRKKAAIARRQGARGVRVIEGGH